MICRTTNSTAETEQFAVKIAQQLRAGDVLAFRGGLGAGKTAFVRGLAQGLGARDEVSSPTFALVHEYGGGRLPLVHFDMYRIDSYDALYSTGFYDYVENGSVLAIEWSENIETALPPAAITVSIETLGENERRICLEGGGRF